MNPRMEPAMVVVRVDGAKAVIEINRPGVRNAIGTGVLQEFDAALTSLENDRGVRVVFVSGARTASIAGGDIEEMRDLDPPHARAFLELANRILLRLAETRLVSIAVIGDYALGGGAEVAMACDLRVARPDSTIGFPEVRLGVFPGWGGTQRLARLVGMSRAHELILTARRISGVEAERLGLVNRLSGGSDEEVWDTAQELADEILLGAPTAVSLAKRAIHQASEGATVNGLKFELEAWLVNMTTEDRAEGLSAFLERRQPVWST